MRGGGEGSRGASWQTREERRSVPPVTSGGREPLAALTSYLFPLMRARIYILPIRRLGEERDEHNCYHSALFGEKKRKEKSRSNR